MLASVVWLVGCREATTVEVVADPVLSVVVPVATSAPTTEPSVEPDVGGSSVRARREGAAGERGAGDAGDERRKVLWRAGEGENYALVVDEEMVATLTEPERAVLGYFAALIGTACEIDPRDRDLGYEERRLRCRLTDALRLGPQCGQAHADLVSRWIPADVPERCDRTPFTAYSRAAYGELALATRGRRHEVTYEAAYTLGPGRTTWTWSERVVFEPTGDGGELAITDRRVTRGALPPSDVWLAHWLERHPD